MSRVDLRIANVLPDVTLKILAFQDQHQNKDACDLIDTLLNAPDAADDEAARLRQQALATIRAFLRGAAP